LAVSLAVVRDLRVAPGNRWDDGWSSCADPGHRRGRSKGAGSCH
jgi:hypothetical protein